MLFFLAVFHCLLVKELLKELPEQDLPVCVTGAGFPSGSGSRKRKDLFHVWDTVFGTGVTLPLLHSPSSLLSWFLFLVSFGFLLPDDALSCLVHTPFLFLLSSNVISFKMTVI